MDPTITKILQAASDNPEYQAIANYLMSRRSMPNFELRYMPGKYGTFTTPGLFSSGQVPERGIVSFNEGARQWDPKAMAPTAAHEMTHAAEKQLIKQYYETKQKQNKTDLDRQFMNNFQKIIGSNEPEISKWLKQVAPSFSKNEEGYRATSTEGLAFGLEQGAFKNAEDGYKTPLHVNPTIATTLMLLLDQAQRLQDQQPQSQGR